MGFFALISDHPVVHHVSSLPPRAFLGGSEPSRPPARSQDCGKTYHIWKYGLLNLVVWIFATFSYCWLGGQGGGGEGARARAMVLTIFYGAFTVWGALMWQRMGEDVACWDVLESRFHVIFRFHHYCTVFDAITAILFFTHESYVGKAMGNDFTIMANVVRGNAPQPKDSYGKIAYQGVPPHAKGVAKGEKQAMGSPTTQASLAPQLSEAYDKIMKNTQPQNSASSSLPQTEP